MLHFFKIKSNVNTSDLIIIMIIVITADKQHPVFKPMKYIKE